MKYEEMSLRQKIGQMIVTGFPEESMSREFINLVEEYKVGNVILFQYNQKSRIQLKALCKELKKMIERETGFLPFITSDEEGGIVSRLPLDMPKMPSPLGQTALGEIERVRKAAKITGRELKEAGINFNLAPVLDINNNPNNPVIGVRSYGTTSQEVCTFGMAALKGYRDAKIMTTGKHFPGHGDTNQDSHLTLPTITKTWEELLQGELIPFQEAIRQGIPAITIAHICFPKVEPENIPATMSRKVITGLLREKLGFQGLIISDCMEMK
ncbi:glycoside hydrolase family 3 protein, partial [bacterium 1XD42-8]